MASLSRPAIRDPSPMSVQAHIALQPRDFVLADVLADLAPELLILLVRTILLELPQHARTEARNRQDVGVARRVQVDWHEDVLLEPRELRVVYILVDLP